ncbi:hypothetical protein NUW54_g2308 [Trametes sanguinea]|uniref:Uncharacterized protein n=2 Tax=Trametes sanguinea TaxID=158606 RepID=A0ACC1PUC5_9APHY|nr:hypothetical protein NUW54_g6290 [Trametes sanguinea]KAJ3011016.1 hypothetical protein NUW54_g2308 [Trametes sanguinea]
MTFFNARLIDDDSLLDDGQVRSLLSPYIIALFFEALLFGAFSITFIAGLWSMMRHAVLSLRIETNGFAEHAGTARTVYKALVDQSSWTADGSRIGNTRFIILVIQTLLGGVLMIFRVFALWGGRVRTIVLPGLLMIAGTVTGASLTLIPFLFYVFSFFTNAICTGLIMWHTLRSGDRSAPPKFASRRFTLVLRKVTEAILQSAIIYSAAYIVLIFANILSSVFVVFISGFPSLIGLALSLIILRLAQESRENENHVIQAPGWREASGVLPSTKEHYAPLM